MKFKIPTDRKPAAGRFLRPMYLILFLIVFCSHDLYIKMDTYFLKPNQEALLSLYNGTFEKSDNIITRDRILDASVIAHGTRTAIDSDQWSDQDSTITQLTFNTGKAGTYVVGVSTKARNIKLTADKFNSYLKNDGVLDMLEERTSNNLLDTDAVENYQKHVKAIYQVGDEKTKDWSAVFGYPIEFIPLSNPYESYSGEQIDVQVLLDGKPLSNQLIFANHTVGMMTHTHDGETHEHEHRHDGGTHERAHKHQDDEMHSHQHEEGEIHTHEHTHEGETHEHEHRHGDSTHEQAHEHQNDGGHSHQHEHKGQAYTHEHTHDSEVHEHEHNHDDDAHKHNHNEMNENGHSHTSGQQLRTNEKGIVTIDLPKEGIYYLRTIHMTNVSDKEITHQSKWATLTFEVTHQHGSETHTHEEHDHEDGLPDWVFILGSLLVIGLLFLVFRRKS